MTNIWIADVSCETAAFFYDATNSNAGTGLLDGPSDFRPESSCRLSATYPKIPDGICHTVRALL